MAREASVHRKAAAMISDDSTGLSSQEMGERFDLLATDAKEYALFLVGLEGRLLCWNAGAERIFGYHTHEIIGQHFSRFFSPEDVLTGLPEHELKTALDGGRADGACWQVRKDGTRFWCWATVTLLLNENKQARSFAVVIHDLSESEATEAQRKRADGLAEANRHKEEFMAMLSHELRSPLSPILNALNILRQMRTNDPIIENAGNIIDRQVGQMVRLVDDLLDISRITKGKLRLTKEKVDLRVVANRAAETTRPLMEARKHEFSVSLPIQPLWVNADPARLEQVVVNLLNNAAKYTDTGGLIRMTLSREESEAVIHVRDNGVGIAPELLHHVFDLFTQVDGSLGRSYGGLGIGLALARNLVEMQDGRLQARSDGLGKGSEFTVKLPAESAALGQETKTVLAPGRLAGRSLAHPHCGGQRRCRRQLEHVAAAIRPRRASGPHRPVGPANGLGLFGPRWCCWTSALPGMDGYQVAQTLREKPEFKGVTVCALTGYTPSEGTASVSRNRASITITSNP